MIDFNQVKIDSVGKWPGIFQQFGIDVGTGKHQACPNCGGKDRFRFDDKEGQGTWICNQCGAGDGWRLLTKIMNIDFKTAITEVSKIIGSVPQISHQVEKPPSPDALRKIYKTSHPIRKWDAAARYLQNRGLKSMPKSLRCGPAWEPETKQEVPTMLATFQLPDGEAVTLHRTFLTEDGQKLNIKSPKKIMPTLKKMSGGAVRLYEIQNGTLGIAEGIETAIAVHNMLKIPTWAALTSTLLASFVPPKGVDTLVAFGDSDANYAGQKAVYTLVHRIAIETDINVSVELPEVLGEDFLDEMVRVNKN